MGNLRWISMSLLFMSLSTPWAEGNPVRVSFTTADAYGWFSEPPRASIYLPEDFGANGGTFDLSTLRVYNGGSVSIHMLSFDRQESGPVAADAVAVRIMLSVDADMQYYPLYGYTGTWEASASTSSLLDAWEGSSYVDWSPSSGISWDYIEPFLDVDRFRVEGYRYYGGPLSLDLDYYVTHNTLYVSPRQGAGIPAPIPEPTSLAVWGLITLAGFSVRGFWSGRRGLWSILPKV